MAPLKRPPPGKGKPGPPSTGGLFGLLRFLALALVFVFLSFHKLHKEPNNLSVAQYPTLVVYVFGGSDPEYKANLRFFIEEAVREGDGCEYIFVLQQDGGSTLNSNSTGLPTLPSNAKYVEHPNECFDWGTVGWVLEKVMGGKDGLTRRFKRFIWLNSSVRGPFLPKYVRGKLHWTRPFTDRLSPTVKLVGSTISCGGAQGLPGEPHVQSYVVATDQIGLAILKQTPGVFDCWEDMGDVVIHSEIGASRAILDAGYSIDSLMSRYSTSVVSNWSRQGCNGGLNPLQPSFNDGIDVDPFEVLFIKVKESFLRADGWQHAKAATRISEWYSMNRDGDHEELITRNAWLEGPAEAAQTEALRRGKDCFDWEFYLNSNKYDLEELRVGGRDAAWMQFITMGVYEGRPHRWKCHMV